MPVDRTWLGPPRIPDLCCCVYSTGGAFVCLGPVEEEFLGQRQSQRQGTAVFGSAQRPG